MTLEQIAFWLMAVVLVGAALAVVLSKNLFHSVLWLALALVGTAGIFLSLNAEFLASVQILLYAGGVVTVVVFAIVVTERLVGERLHNVSRRLLMGTVVSGGVLAALLNTLAKADLHVMAEESTADVTRWLGISLLTQRVLAFELLGVLLLVGLLAASYFARPADTEED